MFRPVKTLCEGCVPRRRFGNRTASVVLAALCSLAPPGLARAGDGLPEFSDFALRLGQDTVAREAAEAKLKLALAALYPKVSIGSDYITKGTIDYSPDITKISPSSNAERDPTSLGGEVSWRLFDGMRNLNDIRAAKEGVAYAFQASLDTRQKLLLEKADKTLALVRDRAVLDAASGSVRRYGQAYGIARDMLAEGMMTVSQVALAGAALENAKALAAEAASALKAGELDYRKLTGSYAPAKLALEPPERKLPQSSALAASRAQADSPFVKMAFHLEREAEFKADSAAGLYAPTIDLVARHTRTFDPSPALDRVDNSALLVRMRVPIFDATIAPTVSLARAEAAQRRYDRQDATLAVSVEAKKQYELSRSLADQVAALRRQIRQARAATVATREELKAGARTISDVLEAEQRLLSAEIALADAGYARALAVFRTLAAAGALDPADVGGGAF